MRKTNTIFFWIILGTIAFLTQPLRAQLSDGSKPASFTAQLAPLESVVMPRVDKETLLAQDRLEQAKGLPFRFGYPFEVSYNMENSGKWEVLPNGTKVWRIQIYSQDATSLNFTFSDFWMPAGGKFYMYDPARVHVFGGFDAQNNNEANQLGTGIVPANTVIVEYNEPAAVSAPGRLQFATIVHGYKDIFKDYPLWEDFGTSGSCNINVNCPQGVDWQNEKRSVAMILSAGGSRLCTGALINNARQDLKPYFLTANHCYDSGLPTWVLMFRYESPNCNIIDGPLNYTMSGSTLKARNAASDFCLLQFNQAVPDTYRVHYSGWNRLDVPATSGVGIHHPDGDIKKISFVSVPFEHDTWSGTPASSHWRTRWSAGVTEPGSSGSPIYNQSHQIVGQLHGGPSSCTASDKSDLYGKFSMSWNYGTTPETRLKDWLDPDNTGINELAGWDPSIGTPDTVAPTRITNLAVASKTSSSIMLGWSAPLDTSYGGVAKYDVRMSATPITDTTSFNNATAVTFSGRPKPAGQPEQLLIKNLPAAARYFFAVRSEDNWRNRSLISNVVIDTTMAAPRMQVTPALISRQLEPNTVVTDTVRVKNIATATSTLDYTLELANNTFPGLLSAQLVPQVTENVTSSMVKGTDDMTGGQSIDGMGGPDAGGYKWIDSDEPNGPAYVWNDISTTGTLVTNWLQVAGSSTDPKDDGYAGPFDLGFNFKFYGSIKTQAYVMSNGFLLFTVPGATYFTNAAIPASALPNEIICPFWDDLDGRTQGTVHYKQDGNRFIVQFTNWQKYSATGSLTFQVVLYSNGRVMFYYNNMNATLNSATVGIENGAGTTGLQVAYNATYVKNNLAVKFAAEPDWLQTAAQGGTLNTGATALVVLTMRSEDFVPGNYAMDLKITGNDPLLPLVTVPVRMTLVALPVELTAFTASAQRDEVVLRWGTATETNNRGFAIERKLKGDASWKQVAFVNGHGTTTEPVQYTYRDRAVRAGTWLYRLVQADLDGSSKAYNEVEAEVGLPAEYSLEQNYPNPFNPSTSIAFSLPEKAEVTLAVYNELGQMVKLLTRETREAGYHSVTFDASGMASGTYICAMKAHGKADVTRTIKMLLVK